MQGFGTNLKFQFYNIRLYFSNIRLSTNPSELKKLFSAPTLLKHRIVLTLIYSAGLRGQEVINLKLYDIDFERKTIHIRQSKYKKDRIVPLSDARLAILISESKAVPFACCILGDKT